MDRNNLTSRPRPLVPRGQPRGGGGGGGGAEFSQPISIPRVEPMRAEAYVPASVSVSSGAVFVLSAADRRRLTILNATMVAFHFTLVLVTCFVGNLWLSAPLYTTKLQFELNNGTTGFVLTPTSEYFSGFPLTVLTAVFFAISATFHFGNATIWREHYFGWLANKKSITRWAEYYASASVMILLIGYSTGLRSFIEMLYAFFLVSTTMSFGWLSDEANRPKSDDEWENPSLVGRLVPHMLGYPPLIAVWFGLIFTLVQNTNECGPPPYVYALVFGELGMFFSFGLPQLYQIMSPPKNYIYGEIVYQILSFTAKGTLGVILLGFVLLYDTFDASVSNSLANSTNCTVG